MKRKDVEQKTKLKVTSVELPTQTDATVESSSQQDSTTEKLDTSSVSDAQDGLKGRHFWFVVYPDSAPPDWREQLEQTGLPFCVSPLHDKDVNPDGTPKKHHYHVIISWGNSTTYKNARSLCDTLNCPRPQMLKNVTGAYRYHQHKDNPEKYQYDEVSEIHNGWEKPLDSNEVRKLMDELTQFVFTNDIREYAELIIEARFLGGEYADVAMNHTVYFNALVRSFRHSPMRSLMRYYNGMAEGKVKEQIGKLINNYTEIESEVE